MLTALLSCHPVMCSSLKSHTRRGSLLSRDAVSLLSEDALCASPLTGSHGGDRAWPGGSSPSLSVSTPCPRITALPASLGVFLFPPWDSFISIPLNMFYIFLTVCVVEIVSSTAWCCMAFICVFSILNDLPCASWPLTVIMTLIFKLEIRLWQRFRFAE